MFRTKPSNLSSIYGFFVGLFSIVVLFLIFPELSKINKKLNPHLTSKFAICAIFLISGMKVSSTNLLKSLKNCKLVCYSMVFSFVLYPLIGYFFSISMKMLNLKWVFHRGFIIATCMPPPVSAGIVMTTMFGGEEATAIAIAGMGNLAASVATPILLKILVVSDIDLVNIHTFLSFFKLFCLILFPTIFGQIIRRFLPSSILESQKLSHLSKFCLFYIVFCGFSFFVDSKTEETFQISSVFLLILNICFVSFTIYILVMYLDATLGITTNDSELWAMLFSVSMKSLGTGIAIILIWSETDDSLISAVFPLIIFEPVQIMLSMIIGLNLRKHKKIVESNV